MRVKCDYRTSGAEAYKSFKSKHPNANIDKAVWTTIVKGFCEEFANHILETGDQIPLPMGIGQVVIQKRKRKKVVQIDGEDKVILPINWKKTRELGKKIYHMNFHTEGYSFRWKWFSDTSRIKQSKFFNFKAARKVSRELAAKLINDPEAQHIYKEIN